ncbi:MAG: UDP-N-acetylmuramate--L-alanine ligase [Anaerolineaceae bacterium]
MKKVHFIGIGGTGLSAIALMLLDRGYQVTGSDMAASTYFNAVTEHGAQTILGHSPELATQADLIIRSSAIKDDDPEVLAARAVGTPVLKRSDFLQELTAGKQTLAVAGSHGKTTTTAILICLLDSLNLDPSFILGAEIKSLGTNSRTGSGLYFVIEADEYDYMFLGLNPTMSIITNIEHDHPDCFPTPESYAAAFKAFLLRTDPNGAVLVCADDSGVTHLLEILEETSAPVLTYGFAKGTDYQINSWSWDGHAYQFSVVYLPDKEGEEPLGCFTMSLPGKHNLSNATAALAVIHQLGLSVEEAAKGLEHFSGTERRFDIVLDQGGVVIINDYGHHPTQITATLQAARELFPEKTLWAVWEPHTFSRTEKMQAEFITSLDLADQVLITRIYAAREVDDAYTPQSIAEALPGKKGRYLPDFGELVDYLISNMAQNDVIVILSAGKGPQISTMLKDRLSRGGTASTLEEAKA